MTGPRVDAPRPPDLARDLPCQDEPDLWFPHTEAHGSPLWDAPRAACMACPVLNPCAEWALTDPDPTGGEGMWGAMTPHQRAGLRLVADWKDAP